MEIVSTYSVKIKHYNHIFDATIPIYRQAVDLVKRKAEENRSSNTGKQEKFRR